MSIDDLLSEFEFLGDWEDRCDYLIDLGFELPEMPVEAKTEANRVHGCQSNVWLITDVKRTNGEPVIEIIANSDSQIVKGLIAVLLTIYSGKTPKEMLAIDVKEIFDRLGLSRNLSPQRKNGLNGMVLKIRGLAAMIREGEQGERGT